MNAVRIHSGAGGTQQGPYSTHSTSVAYLNVLQFLCLTYMPGRLCAWQTAALLGCEEHHIPILVAAGILKPLGNPPKSAPKYYARDYVLALAADARWLARASDALVAHWANNNSGKKQSRNTSA